MGAQVSIAWNEGKARSKAIDRQIRQESRSCEKVNMFLLGSDPERSTIVKQMKIQHGLTNEELVYYRLTVYRNSLNNAQALVRAIRYMSLEYTDPTNHAKADLILDYNIQHSPSFVFSAEIAVAIHQLWRDPILPSVMNRRNEFWLDLHAEYFFEEILRIGSPDYLPTIDDILRTREYLTPIIETHLTFGALRINIVNPDGQRARAKWIHYFECVDYIIFCVSLSEYDLVLEGDGGENQLDLSLILFESIVNSRWFTHTPVVVLLNNIDTFKDKLSKIPLERYFPDYAGGADVNEALKYIQRRFMQVNRERLPTYFILHRAINATTDLILNIVRNAILEEAWKELRKAPSRAAAMRVLRLRRILSPTPPRKSRLLALDTALSSMNLELLKRSKRMVALKTS